MAYPNTHSGAYQQAKEYKAQQVLTASPEEILILLYEGAIRFLLLAKKGLAAGDIEKSHTNLVKAQDIVTELMVTLNVEVGGEAAKGLYALYEYFHFRLVEANLKKDEAAVDEVLGHLRSLKTTWEEAIRIAQRERQAESKGGESQIA